MSKNDWEYPFINEHDSNNTAQSNQILHENLSLNIGPCSGIK